MKNKEELLISLYKAMSEMTLPKCKGCMIPYSCCSSEYCEGAIKRAKETFSVDLERTNHPKLPLMGPSGCTALPHYRPDCTLHTCKINSLGFEPSENQEWHDKYFKLREEIDKLEWRLISDKQAGI